MALGGNIKGITIEIGGNTTKLQQALREVDKTTQETTKRLRGVNKALRFNPGNTELIGQKQRALQDQIKATEERLKRLKEADIEAKKQLANGELGQKEYDDLRREIIETESKLGHFKKELGNISSEGVSKVGEAFKAAGKKIQEVSAKLVDVGQNLSKKVTLPLVGVGTLAAKSAIEFESAMAGVRKTVDLTDEEFSQMSKSIQEMSEKMPASTTEIAAVAEAAGQLGISKENIVDFSKTMIDMGESTNLSSDQAATSLARFANITGMSQDKFSNLGSAIVDLGNNFATTEAEIVDMGLRLAGTGTQIGLTQADIMGLSTAMSSVGISAEAGGTAMSQVMNKMNNSLAGSSKTMAEIQDVAEDLFNMSADELINNLQGSSEWLTQFAKSHGVVGSYVKQLAKDYEKTTVVANGFADIAEKGGLAAEDFGRVWKEKPSEALTAFVKGLAEVKKEGGNVNMTLEQLGIKGVRETDTLNRLSGAAELLPGAFATANEAFGENSALSEEAGKRYETLESKISMLKNKLSNLGVAFGEELMPYIEDAIEWVGGLVEKFKSLDDGTKEMIVKIGLFAAAAGPVILVIGKIGMAVGGLLKTIGTVLTVLPKVIALVTANPIGLAIGAAIAAIGLLIANWDTVKEAAAAVRDWVVEKWEALSQGVSDAVDAVTGWVSEKWDAIKTKTEEIWNGITGFIGGIWDGITTTVGGAIDGVATTIGNTWDGIKTTTGQVWDGIKTGVGEKWESIKTTASTTWEGMKTTIGTAWDNIKTDTGSALEKVGSTLGSTWEDVKTKTATTWETAKSTVAEKAQSIATSIGENFSNAKRGVEETWGKITGAVSKGMGDALRTVTDFVGKFFDAGRNIVNSIANGISSAIGAVTGAIGKVAQKVRNFLPFSPAKEGPLRDLNKLNFGGTISDSIYKAKPKVSRAMGYILHVPEIQAPGMKPGRGQAPQGTGPMPYGGGIYIAHMEVRDDSDIRKVANEIERLRKREGRVRYV